jgi:L-asparaginase
MVPHYDLNPNIMVLSLFPGIQANIFEHALDAPELKGVVMRSFGSGNAPQQSWLIETLKKASQRGVSIVNISQCVTGFVEMGRYDTGYQLKGTGVISGQDCTVEAAVTKLMYLYGRYGDDTKTIRELLSIPLAGEFQI